MSKKRKFFPPMFCPPQFDTTGLLAGILSWYDDMMPQ